jgi:hypothetical protein
VARVDAFKMGAVNELVTSELVMMMLLVVNVPVNMVE